MNQYNILPTDPESRQAAVDAACEHAGLPASKTLRVAVVAVTQSHDEEDLYVFQVVDTEERVGYVQCDPADVDSDGDRISTYNGGLEDTYADADRCESACDVGQVPGRVRVWSEEDEFLDSRPDGFRGLVDIDVPYMILGTAEDYAEVIAAYARTAAIAEGLIEE